MSTRTFTPSGRPEPGRSPVAGRKQPLRLAGVSRRRQLPYLLLGVLLVVGCSAGGVVVAAQVGEQEGVLVLARPVSVGQVLSDREVREVGLSAGRGLDLIPAGSRSAAVGRPVAYTLPAGTLLTRDVLGPARVPPTGQAVVAVGVKAGRFPPGVQPGNRVTVVATPDTESGTSQAGVSAWEATVTGVHADAADQSAVLSLLMAEADARLVAALPDGRISVVTVPGVGR
ncbi:flagellar biosynthesis protein FlgA [Streptomyces roseirectus]|uniref:Flagellar biosynthesis protein FlgA n=1 Tax=Streptomyces roseirectus TaxID=2768066 RepID=A0A7H0IQA9_9ACTN|nr:flagellar biosynthesis protein FlgA [Streptomyces roseirectus]QNP74975.1 flagellar biosynthesis protein FlgA [Streptomyces roseirectus]